MPPIRRIATGPTSPQYERCTAICVRCVKVIAYTAHRWDVRRDMCCMCRMCAIERAESEGYRARHTHEAPPPPRIKCNLCTGEFSVAGSHSGETLPDRRQQCERREKCSSCKKIKKKKHFQKSAQQRGVILKTCLSCREKSINWNLSKRRQAEDQGVYMRPRCFPNPFVWILTTSYPRTTVVYFWSPSGAC